jgi:hypothetical protein
MVDGSNIVLVFTRVTEECHCFSDCEFGLDDEMRWIKTNAFNLFFNCSQLFLQQLSRPFCCCIPTIFLLPCSNTWLGRSPQQNWIAETIVGFVLGRFSSKLAEIAFVRWKFQENQAFQVLGWLMVNASKETFSDTWLARSPQKN